MTVYGFRHSPSSLPNLKLLEVRLIHVKSQSLGFVKTFSRNELWMGRDGEERLSPFRLSTPVG